jgi:hypothetical protein
MEPVGLAKLTRKLWIPAEYSLEHRLARITFENFLDSWQVLESLEWRGRKTSSEAFKRMGRMRPRRAGEP